MKIMINEMAKQEYDYLWIAKRLEFLIENELVYVGEAQLKINYCDQYYVNELQAEAEELLQTLAPTMIMNYIKNLPYLPKDFKYFIDYAKEALSELITLKLKLHNDECVSHFKIEYEKDMLN